MYGQIRATRGKRDYNRWVADETMEDFALRFTARRARRWTSGWVANTAIGSISFLALEVIGAVMTLNYGFQSAFLAILVVGAVLFLTGLPISYYAARYGVDIDLLTRGAGFGYIGSTVTSLIYATFTFLFFALEASIMALALEMCFGLPLVAGYILSAVIVIPLVAHGFTKISAFQAWTQPLWVFLHILPFALLLFAAPSAPEWTSFQGLRTPEAGMTILTFGATTSIAFSLIAQIGEQVDFLRFLPEPKDGPSRRRWWAAMIAAGPGWAVLGAVKMLAGSYLVVLAIGAGTGVEHLADPTHLYFVAFNEVITNPALALFLTGTFVILSQLKINVTNAYAGSIAWSNFFSRLTHSHPGRVVWLVFNVAIAFLLMQFGVFGALEATLGVYSNVALAWIGAIVADLVINKPLGFSPRGIEFRRAYLFDLNPVGIGSMGIAVVLGLSADIGVFGPVAAALSSFISLGTAFVLAPVIAVATRGRFYIARQPAEMEDHDHTCCVCGYGFEAPDIAYCPFFAGPICSLCCSLESSCADFCKPEARAGAMLSRAVDRTFPARVAGFLRSRWGVFTVAFSGLSAVAGTLMLYLSRIRHDEQFGTMLGVIFCASIVLIGVGVWMVILIQESRVQAREEADRQTSRLLREIRAHERTDHALQEAKEKAEAANLAKTRYLAGLSHELRTPLNSIFGFAQIIEADPDIPARRREAVSTIRRSSEHLAGLIEGLLDISKIEVGRMELSRDRINLPSFLRQVTSLFEDQAREKGLAFLFETTGSMPAWIMSDEKRLRQIFLNLLGNAIRYTDDGSVTLRFLYRNEIATIEVIDTGEGIHPSRLERIWLPFERGSATGRNGSGLGLTITKLLVEVLGGEITVNSTPGKGSTFRVRLMLPSVPDHSARAIRRHQIDVQRRATGYGGRRRNLMIVDDDRHHLSLFESFFSPLGFNVISAPDVETAVSLLEEVAPDLFVLDIDLPGTDGWSLARHLRAEGHRATPILMCSGHALESRHRGSEERDYDAFITKPYNLTDLLETIAAVLKLTLVYAEPGGERAVPNRPIETPDLSALAASARIGHARGVAERLSDIETRQGGETSQIAELRALLNQFDMNGLERKISEWMRV